ncbi:DNA-3-methyladenine glycosylase family protein [Subtercola endophyticus]|uniref:DNA-3-methyladenine glycosylase family protein n=1 Tax=Subtercola endophyticus TaxID=2895559 RepID=UPI001E46E0C1|nr:DNA-3-methyladenine glycosylase 2 family protein [Subtercola endophyticus]UFS58432.1 DNA-3-methyladenine glycosylase 2 family protein [Subtercola endophyticus]
MDALLESPAPLTTTYLSSRALNVRQTVGPLLRGATEPTMRLTPNGFWRVMRTPDGPATLRVEVGGSGAGASESANAGASEGANAGASVGASAGAGAPAMAEGAHHARVVHASAWGEGAEWVLDALPALLGHGDSWNDLDLSRVPLLAEVRRRNPGMWLTRTSLVFESLVPSILEQKVTTVEARRSWHYLLRKFGEPAPGPAPEGMRVQPSARGWAMIPSWEWHRAGVGPDRSRAIVMAAAVVASLDRLGAASPAVSRDTNVPDGELPGELPGGAASTGGPFADVLEKLQTLHGVGPWTAAETSQRSHGHPDAVSVGDYHLAAHVGWVLVGKPVDDDGMLELLEPWRGQRQRIVRLILASGIAKPRFGPRATIQDHRGH